MVRALTSNRISFGLTVDEPFDDAVDAVRTALAAEGFGVLSTVDVAATLTERLDEFHTPYVILGACNPALASWALRAEPHLGVLLPCNVVVRSVPEGVAIDFMDPESVLDLVADPEVAEVASEVKTRLLRVAEALTAPS